MRSDRQGGDVERGVAVDERHRAQCRCAVPERHGASRHAHGRRYCSHRRAGQTVTLSTTVTAVAPAVGVPTGTVTFRDGATALSTVTLVNGSVSLTISTLAVGSHSLTAVYNASPNFLGSTSPTVTQAVNSPTTTSLSPTPNPSDIAHTVTLTATVSPVPPAVGTPTG